MITFASDWADTGIGIRIVLATTLVWLGMVLAISFLEAPLRFRAPGLDLRTGLAIGRIVFGALNRIEVLWACIVVVGLVVDRPSLVASVAAGAGVAVLLVQLGVVRPRLNRRSDLILAGHDIPRSSSHHAYVALEVAKVVALITVCVELLST